MTKKILMLVAVIFLGDGYISAKGNAITENVIPSVNLNTVTGEELLRLPYVDRYFADVILKYRKQYGGFVTPDEIIYPFTDYVNWSQSNSGDLKLLQRVKRLYAVSPSEWKNGVVTNYYDLHSRYIMEIIPIEIDGRCLLIRLPDGGNLVVGAGSKMDESDFVDILKKYIKPKGLFSRGVIDWLIIPSYENEWFGNVPALLKKFSVKNIYGVDLNKISVSKMGWDELRNLNAAGEIKNLQPLDTLSSIDFLQTESKISIKVFYPQYDQKIVSFENSICLKVIYGRYSVFVAGNFTNGVQNSVSKQYRDDLGGTVIYADPDYYNWNMKNRLNRNMEYITRPGYKGSYYTDGVLFYHGEIKDSDPEKILPIR